MIKFLNEFLSKLRGNGCDVDTMRMDLEIILSALENGRVDHAKEAVLYALSKLEE